MFSVFLFINNNTSMRVESPTLTFAETCLFCRALRQHDFENVRAHLVAQTGVRKRLREQNAHKKCALCRTMKPSPPRASRPDEETQEQYGTSSLNEKCNRTENERINIPKILGAMAACSSRTQFDGLDVPLLHRPSLSCGPQPVITVELVVPVPRVAATDEAKRAWRNEVHLAEKLRFASRRGRASAQLALLPRFLRSHIRQVDRGVPLSKGPRRRRPDTRLLRRLSRK